jgi:hypothetical protein
MDHYFPYIPQKKTLHRVGGYAILKPRRELEPGIKNNF